MDWYWTNVGNTIINHHATHLGMVYDGLCKNKYNLSIVIWGMASSCFFHINDNTSRCFRMCSWNVIIRDEIVVLNCWISAHLVVNLLSCSSLWTKFQARILAPLMKTRSCCRTKAPQHQVPLNLFASPLVLKIRVKVSNFCIHHHSSTFYIPSACLHARRAIRKPKCWHLARPCLLLNALRPQNIFTWGGWVEVINQASLAFFGQLWNEIAMMISSDSFCLNSEVFFDVILCTCT